MNLYYAKPSPFARRVRVLLRERGPPGRVEEIAIAPWESPVELLTISPASKVPAPVLDDGSTLTESVLIATHLDGLGDAAPLLPGDTMPRLLHAWGLAEGLTSAARSPVVEARRDVAQRSPAWLARQLVVPASPCSSRATREIPLEAQSPVPQPSAQESK